LYELARGKRSFEERTKGAAASMETVERITEAMLDCLLRSGYVAARSEELAEEKLRRMLRRFSLDAADAEVFLGMVRKMQWKMGGK
jgi:tRNA C32,U32 (ribose-2'-O)-methylase TrmJ